MSDVSNYILESLKLRETIVNEINDDLAKIIELQERVAKNTSLLARHSRELINELEEMKGD